MLIHTILGLSDNENICFVEESYSSLKNNTLTLQYLQNIRTYPDIVISGIKDEVGNVIGLVVHNPESEESESFLAIFTDIVSSRPVPNNSSKIFSNILKDIKVQNYYDTSTQRFYESIIEYFSVELVNRRLCENCHINKEPFNMVYIDSRNEKITEILDKYKLHGDILEICCGNGMSTMPLHKMGYVPLTIDNNKCQICQGLEHNVLDPRRTIVLDATRLSDFFHENTFDTIVGFMLGTIYPFNKSIWEKMMLEATKILKPQGMILLTVNKKEEIDILKNALEINGIHGKLIDNTDSKGIYDQWIFIGNK